MVLVVQRLEVLLEELSEGQLAVQLEGQLEGQWEGLLGDMLEVQRLEELVSLEVLEQCLGKDPVPPYVFPGPWPSHGKELVDFLIYNDRP